MMNYLKSLVLGGPKASDAQKNENLIPGDISTIFSAEDFENIITASLDDLVTLYEIVPL